MSKADIMAAVTVAAYYFETGTFLDTRHFLKTVLADIFDFSDDTMELVVEKTMDAIDNWEELKTDD